MRSDRCLVHLLAAIIMIILYFVNACFAGKPTILRGECVRVCVGFRRRFFFNCHYCGVGEFARKVHFNANNFDYSIHFSPFATHTHIPPFNRIAI